MTAPSGARILILLRRIHSQAGDKEFGRVAQMLLALSFKAAGFNVTNNPVGVPDILATIEAKGGFALEAKTSEKGKVSLHDRELQALLHRGLTPAVAVLAFPDPQPTWHFLDARGLPARSYDLVQLLRKPRVDVGFDVNTLFRGIVADRLELILENPDAFYALPL